MLFDDYAGRLIQILNAVGAHGSQSRTAHISFDDFRRVMPAAPKAVSRDATRRQRFADKSR